MSGDLRRFERQVFINCPFDAGYRPLLQALLFTLLDAGMEPRIALESADSGQTRVQKLYQLIRDCGLSIHDISRMEPLAATTSGLITTALVASSRRFATGFGWSPGPI